MPSASRLAERLAEQCKYPGEDRWDFLRVAQYFEQFFDEGELRPTICRILTERKIAPTAVHHEIARLPISYVITTNYDHLMEQAFIQAGKRPRVEWYELQGNQQRVIPATIDQPLVYKLHGTVEHPDTMIATEDDIIEFLSCLMLGEPKLPKTIGGLFGANSVLFIGYGLKDWNVRVLIRALRGRLRGTSRLLRYFAVQRRPREAHLESEWHRSVVHWEKHDKVVTFDVDANEFVAELGRRFDAGEGAV